MAVTQPRLLLLAIVTLGFGCRAKEDLPRRTNEAASQNLVAAPACPQQLDTATIRRFSALGHAMLDLKREIWARSAGVVVTETVVDPPPSCAPWMFPAAIQHPLPVLRQAKVATPPSTPPARRLRHRTAVLFYGQDISNGRFGRWLRSQGFAKPMMTTGALPPNQLLFGDSIPLEDIKAIALQLYMEKMPPVSIRRFASGNPLRIELRGVPYLADVVPLSLVQIRALRIAGPKEW